jgi:hypothetical protein
MKATQAALEALEPVCAWTPAVATTATQHTAQPKFTQMSMGRRPSLSTKQLPRQEMTIWTAFIATKRLLWVIVFVIPAVVRTPLRK